MEPQSSAIRRVDQTSTQAVNGEPANAPKPGRAMMIARLALSPKIAFLKSYIINGGVLRGTEGLKSAVNDWALSFATEAKRYEKHYADDAELKRRARDFSE